MAGRLGWMMIEHDKFLSSMTPNVAHSTVKKLLLLRTTYLVRDQNDFSKHDFDLMCWQFLFIYMKTFEMVRIIGVNNVRKIMTREKVEIYTNEADKEKGIGTKGYFKGTSKLLLITISREPNWKSRSTFLVGVEVDDVVVTVL